MNDLDFTGKRMLIVGGSSGIGNGIAQAFRTRGATVHVCGTRAGASDYSAADGSDLTGLHYAQLDVSRSDTIETFRPPFDTLDGLVLAQGAVIYRRGEFEMDGFRKVMEVNLKSLFFLSQAFGRKALEEGRRGKIINIASMLSFQGGIRVASYTASKHGVLGLTRLFACEWAAKGINVNAIAPGYIETNNTEALRADAERSAAILSRIPAGRWGEPGDIGDAAVFLLARASDYMHGACIPVDGGWLAR